MTASRDDRPLARRMITDVIVPEDSVDYHDQVTTEVLIFVNRLMNEGKYDVSAFPKETLCCAAVARYLGDVLGDGHASLLEFPQEDLFPFVAPGLSLAGLDETIGPIWAKFEHFLQTGGQPGFADAMDPAREEACVAHLARIRGTVSASQYMEVYMSYLIKVPAMVFEEEAWRNPAVQNLDDSLNKVGRAAFARLRDYVLTLPNLRILPRPDANAAIEALFVRRREH